MPLSPGDKLGPYEIMSALGAGGMGEVYRARDTKLKREVALKILPDAFAKDPERLARFAREAQVLASLNHPNIAQIYGLEERALVMELVEGESPKGPLPFDDAWRIASQIVAALEYAHDRGIVHRDLKPANVKVTPEGVVKLLDFGLAKAFRPESASVPDPENSPTLTLGATQVGMVLGTAAYMSPEQAKGKNVDKRADIWSFGVLLYELLTGDPLFKGDDVVETLARVLTQQPDMEKAPPQARKLLRRCLERDPKKRLRDIGEALYLLEEPQTAAAVTAPTRPRTSFASWIAAGVFAMAAAGVSFLHFRESPPQEQALRYTIAPPDDSNVHSFAISPDGRLVAIATVRDGKRQLWLRRLGALETQPMSTTEDARYPFWSPDSRFIGFFAQGKLRKIEASGGPSQPICDAVDGRGGSWNRDDVIVFSDSGSATNTMKRVSASGGVPSEVITAKARYLFPDFLPDGRHFLYEIAGISPDKNGIYFASLDGHENRRLLADSSGVEFLPSAPQSRSGHIVFLRENNLMAQPFDAGSFQTTGDAFPIAEHVGLANGNNYAPVTGSENGILLYWRGGTGAAGGTQLVWYDRAGRGLESIDSPGVVRGPTISPDEKNFAFGRQAAGSFVDIWLRDVVRGTERRLTSDPSVNADSVWSPKGDRIAFRSDRGGHAGDLYQRPVSGSEQDQPLLSTPGFKSLNQWTRDGRFIVYAENDPKTGPDIWVLPMGEGSDRKPTVFLHTEFIENHGQLSPDDHWMSYTSNASGQREVYVRSFPAGDDEQRISTAGGEQARWRGDGKELFYVAPDGKMMAVTVKAAAGSKLTFEKPTTLFDSHIAGLNITYFNYDVTADGKRFLVATTGAAADPSSPTGVPPLTVLVNWNRELKK